MREPTPDYDSSPPGSTAGNSRLRRNSDSGLLDVIDEAGGGGGVKRHASSADKSQAGHNKKIVLNNSFETSTESDESKSKYLVNS